MSSEAQVLARPGWAGSGVAVEPWWHRAVFYRIDISRFQDGTGEGRGNLAGVTQRLDYLQGLGVDALVLNPDSGHSGPGVQTTSPDGFDDLTRQAASHRLRVIVALSAPSSQRSDAIGQYLAHARAWLNQGAAGLYVPTRELAALNNPDLAAYIVRQLRTLTNSFPGERILLADAVPDMSGALGKAIGHDAQLTAGPAISPATPDAASLRQQMLTELGSAPSLTTVLLASRHLPPNLTTQQRSGLERALAAMLLASRTAVLIDYGQELGEREAVVEESRKGQPGQGPPGRQKPDSANLAPLMQWTPTNLTRQPKAATLEATPSQSGVVYGSFHPYVKPLPRTVLLPPPVPDVVLSDTPPPVDPGSLPGFTSGNIDPALAADTAPNSTVINVAVEDADPRSLLNLYRRLIQLHHENDSIRNGVEDVLDYDAMDALVWMRRAPAGSRTSATVVVACNLSARPLALSLDALGQGHLRRGPLRNLLSVAAQAPAYQPLASPAINSLIIAPDNLFLGELHP